MVDWSLKLADGIAYSSAPEYLMYYRTEETQNKRIMWVERIKVLGWGRDCRVGHPPPLRSVSESIAGARVLDPKCGHATTAA